MKTLLKLTAALNNSAHKSGDTILIGVDSIISICPLIHEGVEITKIQSRGAMVESFYVIQSVEQVYSQYINNKR
jgi:hypothetical protein